eukprot:3778989-Pyramimonas_sp.AAC.1
MAPKRFWRRQTAPESSETPPEAPREPPKPFWDGPDAQTGPKMGPRGQIDGPIDFQTAPREF